MKTSAAAPTATLPCVLSAFTIQWIPRDAPRAVPKRKIDKMSLRAIWKGIVNLGAIEVPVKLYSALEDRAVHFRLLHRKDKQPVK